MTCGNHITTGLAGSYPSQATINCGSNVNCGNSVVAWYSLASQNLAQNWSVASDLDYSFGEPQAM